MFAKLKKKIAEEAATTPRSGVRIPRTTSKESITSMGADSGDDFVSTLHNRHSLGWFVKKIKNKVKFSDSFVSLRFAPIFLYYLFYLIFSTCTLLLWCIIVPFDRELPKYIFESRQWSCTDIVSDISALSRFVKVDCNQLQSRQKLHKGHGVGAHVYEHLRRGRIQMRPKLILNVCYDSFSMSM